MDNQQCSKCSGSGQVLLERENYTEVHEQWKEQAHHQNEWYSSQAGPEPGPYYCDRCPQCNGTGSSSPSGSAR